MELLSDSVSRLRRFTAERLSIAPAIAPATRLIVACLAVFMMFLSSACGAPTPIEPEPHMRRPTPSPTCTLTPAATPPPIPTLDPPVTLVAPEDDTCLDRGSPVTLRWSWPHRLEADEYYRVRLWGAEQIPYLFYIPTEDQLDLSTSDFLPGAYNWAVAVVKFITHEPVSKESQSFHFHIAPPPPVVRSISPMSTLQGSDVPVVISGENFTMSVDLTIGVPLQVTFVNSTTIIATIPMTLEVGEYPVIVVDPRGRGDSTAFLTVKEPPRSTPTPVGQRYAPPQLTGISIIARNVTLRWDWSGVLAKNEWFALRVGKLPDIPHSQYWGKEREYTYSMCTLGGEPGDYVWEVAVCQGNPSEGRCAKQLAVSERGVFSFGGWPSCD